MSFNLLMLEVVSRQMRRLEAELAALREDRDRYALEAIAAGHTWRAVGKAGGFANPYIAVLKRRAGA